MPHIYNTSQVGMKAHIYNMSQVSMNVHIDNMSRMGIYEYVQIYYMSQVDIN
jgi:hypothetical protein